MLLEKSTRSVNLTKRCNFYIPNFNAKHSNIDRILDTRATNHIGFILDWFTKHNKISLIMVNLPNVNSIAASICGDIKLSHDLIIKNVFYFPQFEVN